MPYVLRNKDNQIIVISHSPVKDDCEKLAWNHPDIIEYLTRCPQEATSQLATSDMFMPRILEDLINILIEQGTIELSMFPASAASKLQFRNQLREIIKSSRKAPAKDETGA